MIDIKEPKQLYMILIGSLVIGVFIAIFISRQINQQTPNNTPNIPDGVIESNTEFEFSYSKKVDRYLITYKDGDYTGQQLLEESKRIYKDKFGVDLDEDKIDYDIPGVISKPPYIIDSPDDFEEPGIDL